MRRKYRVPKLALVWGLLVFAAVGCYKSQVQKAGDVTPLDEAKLKSRPPKPFSQRKKMAVLEFEDKTDYGRGRLGRSASNILTTYLSKSGQFALYEREKMASLMKELNRVGDKRFDAATAVAVGKLAHVQLVAIGAVTGFGFRSRRTHVLIFGSRTVQEAEAVVDVRIIDVATGAIVTSDTGRGVVTIGSGQVLGVGTSASYDETTAGNALRASISKFVDNIIDLSI